MDDKETSDGLFLMKRDEKMENVQENERGKLTAEQAVKMLKEKNVEVTLEQAKMIVEFLRKLAQLTISNCLKGKNHKKKLRLISEVSKKEKQ